MTHTNACGTEPFDKVYCLGYQVHHEDWSPFPRVNRLRQDFLDRPYDIDVERLRLVTEAYKEHPTAPRKLQCAYAFKKVLENTTLYVYDEDLILGEIAAPAKASPIYPEFSVAWIIEEILHSPFEEREHDQFYIRNDEERQEILDLCEWWQGKTVADRIEGRLSYDQSKGSETGEKIFQTNLYHYAGTGHLAIDYAKLMRVGYDGLINEAKDKLSKLSMRDPEYNDKRDFYEAMIIMHEAAKTYIERYASLCEEKAKEEQDEKRKEELLMMAENCHQIAGGTPQTFWQAMQLFNIATTLIQVESNGHSISYGRMDQWLYPYYEKDIKNGTITKEFALELIEVEYVKMNNPTKLKDKGSMAVRNGRGFGGESLTIGGVDREGNDATNDLTMLMLEGSAHTRMMNPWVCVRMHENTPYELKVKAVECIRAGYGHPKLFNDAPTIKGMMRKGMTLEEARDYCVVGCVEIDLPGKEYGWHDAAYVNTPKMLEMVINGGRSMNTGIQLGPDTGSLDTYKTFDEVLESVDQQFEYWTNQMCSSLNIIEEAHREIKPLPYVSAFFEDCMESGKDLTEGGAKYNGTGPQASGMATCADELSTIKQLVFDEKKVSKERLLKALETNFEEDEILRTMLLNKVPKYGNDVEWVDELGAKWAGYFRERLKNYKNYRGGLYHTGMYTVSAHVPMGENVGAAPDGRYAGTPLADGGMSPVYGRDTNGPTAVLKSVSRLDKSWTTNGGLLNMKFLPEFFKTENGIDKFAKMLRTFVDLEIPHIQFNVVRKEDLQAAQKNPEAYRGLTVRVAGYTAYFVELADELQNEIIARTSYNDI